MSEMRQIRGFHGIALVTAGNTNCTKLVTSAGYGLLDDLTTTLKLGLVYTVFNEMVVGKAAEITVEYTPIGTVIKIR